jgi:serine phosphatase RsbU (regulator of sigma subunit)
MSRFRRWLVWGYAFLTATTVALGAVGLTVRGSYGWQLRGERVMIVDPGGPAAQAGIRAGDRLTDGALPPPLRGVSTPVRISRGDRITPVTLTAGALSGAERARASLMLVLAALFVVVAGSVWILRADPLVFAFVLFALSAALVVTPRPVAPDWLAARGSLFALALEMATTGATLLLPAALVDFFARFPEGRPGRVTRRLVAIGYAAAFGLFAIATLAAAFSALSAPASPALAFVSGGAFDGLLALFFAGAVVSSVIAFVGSARRAPAHHRSRLKALVWAVALGLLPLALLTLLKNVLPHVRIPGEEWAAWSLLLVPLGFGYATIVHRVFDIGGAPPLNGAASSYGFRPAAFQTLRDVLDEAARALTTNLGLEHCAVFALDGGGLASLAALHGRVPGMNGDAPNLLRLPAPVVAAVALGRAPLALEELSPGGDGEDALELARLADAGTSLLVPLYSGERCQAILALGPRLSGPWFDSAERARLGEFASQASVAVENAELHDRLVERAALERDVWLARRIQDRLLPAAAPVFPTVDVAAATRPAQEIGGDSYDFLPMGRRTLGIALADVCGKGLPAALLLASAQAHLRGRAAETASPGALLARLNDELVAMHQPEKFVCLAFARLDAQKRTLTWANAGLNPPLLVLADGSAHELEHGGLILGVAGGQEYQDLETRCPRGSLVAFYTDGVTDSLQGDEPFGVERLADALARHRHLRAARMVDRVLEESTAWHRDGPADDRTLMILKFL